MNHWIYWIVWGIITLIYGISLSLIRRIYKRHIALLLSIINVKELQIGVWQEIAELSKKQIEELKGERK